MAKNMIIFKTSDNDIFEIEETVAKQSETINSMIIEGFANSTIPLPNITSKTFVKVMEYCKRHAAIATPNTENKEEEIIELGKFDIEFINVDQEVLLDLLRAANYLEVKSLLDLICWNVVNMILSKTPEELRKIFNIDNDFTPEEEEEIRKKNAGFFSE